MKELRGEGVGRRRKKRRAGRQASDLPPAPDLVKRVFSGYLPDELFLAVITYIPTFKGWLYLVLIIYVCTRRCCGCLMRNDLSANLVIDALGITVTLIKPLRGTIHHSDRGSQYGSLAFGKTLRESGVIPAMGSKGVPQAMQRRRA